MKKLLIGILAITCILGSTLTSFADINKVVVYNGGGYVVVEENDSINENEFSRTGVSSGYVYDSSDKKAGYWIRGKKDDLVISKMKAYSPYEGRASVVNGEGDDDDGGWKPTGIYSKASAIWTKSGINKAFYDYRG